MKRVYFIDWLRILAILTVFIFHNAHFFDTMYWHVKNPEQSEGALMFVGFIFIWIMPLFFMLSGAAIAFSAEKSFGVFARGKILRLLIPYIIGVLILIPPQKFLEQVYHHRYAGNYFQYLYEYFSGGIINYKMGFTAGWIGMLGYHLWFLGHLFVMSIVLYPLLRYLSANGMVVIQWIYRRLSFFGGMLLFFIPIAVIRVLLKKTFPEYTDWADLAMFTGYFLIGFIVMKYEGFRAYFLRDRFLALIIALICTIAYFLSFGVKGTFNELFHNNTVYGHYVFQESAGALTTWSWLVFIMAAGIRYLNKESEWRGPLNEAVLPFYILHQTVILIIGYVIAYWDWSLWGKFFLLAGSSLFMTLMIYLLLIRPFKIMRFLSGMRN